MGVSNILLKKKRVLLFSSLLLSFIVFSIFQFYGVASVEDHLVVYDISGSLKLKDLFTSTMSDQFNMYDSPLTSRTDIYRPLYKLTFMIDEWLSALLGIDFYKISNIIYFFISIFIFSLFVGQHLGLRYAIMAIVLYSIHSTHVHAQYSYVNRLGVIVSIYVLSMIYVFYQLLQKRSLGKILLLYLIFLAFVLTKETVVIAFLLPGLAFVIYVFLNKLDLMSEVKQHGQFLAIHSTLIFGLIMLYLYFRTFLFDGLGNYQPAVSTVGIIINILLACQLTIGFKIMFALFAVPVIIYFSYIFLKSSSQQKLLLILIFLLVISLFGPHLLYGVGKRYACASAMIFIFFFLYFLNYIKQANLKWLIVAAFAVPLTVQATDIKLKQLAAFEVRMDIEEQLENIELSSDTIAVVMPYYLNDEATLFRHGIVQYLTGLKNFKDKKIIVLGVVFDADSYYILGTTKKSFVPIVTRNLSKVIVNYPDDGRFEVPHLLRSNLEFDNYMFRYQNQLESHQAVFEVKAADFQVLYFEKLDYHKFALKII